MRKVLWIFLGLVLHSAVAAPPPSKAPEVEPPLPVEGLVPATPQAPSLYRYTVTRRLLVTPTGSSETAATESAVTVALQEPNRIIVTWEKGLEVVYQAVAGDPVALPTDLGRRWVATIRAHRLTSSGSVESIVITENAFVLTTHSASSFDVVVTYGAALPKALAAAPEKALFPR